MRFGLVQIRCERRSRVFQEGRTAEQGYGGIRAQCTCRSVDILCHVPQGSIGWVDWEADGLELRALNARLRNLGSTSRQRGASEGAGEVAARPLWFGENDLAGWVGRERLGQDAPSDLAEASSWPGRPRPWGKGRGRGGPGESVARSTWVRTRRQLGAATGAGLREKAPPVL